LQQEDDQVPERDRMLRDALTAAKIESFQWEPASDSLHLHDHSFMGMVADDVIATGDAYLALIHPDDRERTRQARLSLRADGSTLTHEYRLLSADGQMRWVEEALCGEFAPDGTLCVVHGVNADVTARREAESRLTLLSDISERISALEDPAELLYTVSCALGEHLRVRRCLFTEINLASDLGLVRHDYCRDVPSVAGIYRISDYAESSRNEMMAGHTVVNCDSQCDPRTAASYEKTYAPHGERSYVAVPMLRDGRWVAELWISDDVPRRWSDLDVALLETVAERVWTAVEKLRVNAALRESESRAHFVSESAEVGYWDWDIASDQLFWSPVCRRLFDVPLEEEMSYPRFLECLRTEDREQVDHAVKECLAGTTSDFDIEFRANLRDGSERWIHSKGRATFESGQPTRMAGIALDITSRKAVERQRDELLALERRLRSEADEASVAKDHFLALLSHELRTPMTTILGWAAFLSSDLADPESVQKGIANIEQASRVQARLIDDLLDVSRIVTGKLTLEKTTVDACRLLRNTVDMVQRAAAAKGVEIRLDRQHAPALVFADPTRLQQVVWNLLSNAVKFTPRGGTVTVSLEDGDAIRMRVRDTGVGIDRRFLPHVFERFRQADDGPSRNYGGLGLGLSIVRHIVELHGGSVHADSEGPGLGAEFTVELPPASAASTIESAGSIAPALDALSGVKALVIDDDDGARAVIGTMLTTFGVRVTYAASAFEANELAGSVEPDVLVCDIAMPGEDGYDFIRKLRASGSPYALLPAIAVTAYADSADRARALAAGFDAHLAKPIDPRSLADGVLTVMKRNRTEC
jgi:PAS domain S-box-containing protein